MWLQIVFRIGGRRGPYQIDSKCGRDLQLSLSMDRAPSHGFAIGLCQRTVSGTVFSGTCSAAGSSRWFRALRQTFVETILDLKGISMTIEPKLSFAVLSRRRLLLTMAFAVDVMSGASARDQRAELNDALCLTVVPKKSLKAEARHRTASNSSKSCATCRMFLAPDECVVVEGKTTADSVCALWADKSERRLGCMPDPDKTRQL
jgi:hypothetical protein